MKLHIERREAKEGLVFKKNIYELYVNGELSDGELVAYEKVKDEIGDTIIVEYAYKGMKLDFTISQFIYNCKKGEEGARFVLYRQHEIEPFEAEIKHGVEALSGYLKKVIAGSATGSETIEF